MPKPNRLLGVVALALVAGRCQAADATCEESESRSASSLLEPEANTCKHFERDGYCVLRGLLTATEVDGVEAKFDSLTRPSPLLLEAMGGDYGDPSQGFSADPANFSLINVNNPGRYSHGFTQNAFVNKAMAVAHKLLGQRVTELTVISRCAHRLSYD